MAKPPAKAADPPGEQTYLYKGMRMRALRADKQAPLPPAVRGPAQGMLLMDLPEVLVPARTPAAKRGHAAAPGSGPPGQSCGSCLNYLSLRSGRKTYPKCALMRACWTHGTASDIRKRDAACARWQAKPKPPAQPRAPRAKPTKELP